MKTAVVDVGDLLSVQSALGVEKQVKRVPGVERVEVNVVAGSGTVVFDEKVTDLRRIKDRIRECGHHCRGEIVPKHLCEREDPPEQAIAAVPALPHAAHAQREENAHEILSPEIAALAMSGSSALVAVDALLLKRVRLEGIGRTTAPAPATGERATALVRSAAGGAHGAHRS